MAFVEDVQIRERHQHTNYMTLIARNDDGLKELYNWVSIATEANQFYYIPRLDYSQLMQISNDVLILSGLHPLWDKLRSKQLRDHFLVELNQLSPNETITMAESLKFRLVATCDNLYPSPADLGLYQVIVGSKEAQMRTAAAHIIQDWEWYDHFWKLNVPADVLSSALTQAQQIAESCSATLCYADIVHPNVTKTLVQLCEEAMKRFKLAGKPDYEKRLKKELDLIYSKKFEDYFYVVADMIAYAKQHMFVGPARGSSCGSLVCYLLGITDIDPLPHDLLFERFIDVNREDYPDIDVDFQDDKREMIFDYLREKYGTNNVSRIGTVNVFKAKSALTIVSKELKIPLWEVEDLKNSIIERSSGDSRAAFCILDTFEQLEIGKQTLAKYPELSLSAKLEGHASHTGMHAAGIVVTANPITHHAAINHKAGVAMLDKKDAEDLNLLKIDALGLRTLTVIQDTLDQINWSRDRLKSHRLDDERAFEVLNRGHFAGIFQFEGYALQSVTKQLKVETFEDIAVITALARPGPLSSGGTTEFIKRRTGQSPVKYLHPLAVDITKVTYGVIVYQEQVMQIARHIGALSWEDVSQLRKAMSKSMGKEFFDQYWLKFWAGAEQKGLQQPEARAIWDSINTMGSWAFNRSHAVAYGMISYWCCVLKAYFPLEFAAANLRNAKSDDQSIKILRELSMEGYKYKPFDPVHSQINWTVADGQLIGGLIGIKGVGPKLAESIIRKRITQMQHDGKRIPFSKRELYFLKHGQTPWDKIFEGHDLWKHVFRNPAKYNIKSKLTPLEQIRQDSEGEFVFIAKITEKNLRDHNEIRNLAKRGGVRMEGQTQFLNLTVEDDTGSIICQINRHRFEKYGRPIVEQSKLGDWYLWKGDMRKGFRKIYVTRCIRMTGNPQFCRQKKN